VRALLVVIAAGSAWLAVGAGPAAATNECRGLLVCVPVRGPWVVVPTGSGAPRPRVEFQLTCPRGFLVGGLDAELSDRAIDVTFAGRLGSPVNPGITTSRRAVFVASYVGGAASTPTFRPHIGCVPARGGGGRIPTAAVKVFPPGQPTVRRVRTVRLRPGATRRVTQGCAVAERLVSGGHAVGFYTRRPPDSRLVSSVQASRTVRSAGVTVVARSGSGLRGTKAIVQVAAVCAGGR
jgi:hypothetical protein